MNELEIVNKIKYSMSSWMKDNGFSNSKIVVGISGGIDSAVVAALAALVVGKENVYGVMLPNGEQKDIEDSKAVIEHLGINKLYVDISSAVRCIEGRVQTAGDNCIQLSEQTKINLPARIRMSTLYAIAQTYNGLVLNTCNISESIVGYDTLFGDDAGSYAPIQALTKTEVRALAKFLGIPETIISKAPSDGLQKSSDEERFGFTYDVLDRYIRTGVCEDEGIKSKIDSMHGISKFKMEMIRLPGPTFEGLECHVN